MNILDELRRLGGNVVKAGTNVASGIGNSLASIGQQSAPDLSKKPIITMSKQMGQPYGGYYNPQKNLINIVDYGPENNAKTMTHEMSHYDFQQGRNAWSPLYTEPGVIGTGNDRGMFDMLSPDSSVMRDVQNNNPKLNKYVRNLLDTNIAYKDGYDLPQEMYANRATQQRDIARMLHGRYLSREEE